MGNGEHGKMLVVIMGPTAIGKTSVAIELAKYFNTEVVSADSRQFYKNIQIGTARPTNDEMQGVVHHFINTLELYEVYNVYDYEKEVLSLLNTLFSKNDMVIMAGGSGLYIDAVCKGIDELPDADPELREVMKMNYEKCGIKYLQEELKALDPDFYDIIDKNNLNRLMRAIEVCKLSGKPYSQLRTAKSAKRDFEIVKIGLNTSREILFEKINKRVDLMMKSGLLEEVKKVFEYRTYNSLNTVGYKEIFEYLEGNRSLEWAVEKIKTNTRRYAKRQLTWFKKSDDIRWFEAGDVKGIKDYILSLDR